ncbi:DUF6600 domain-containing protein [Dechloromonas sp.]|uniref:DUF6600 domain-containing protein n=1 Tax=Dechloromonas sp. TaxID=1917218 RepID=UPI00286D8A14|nr:DUF6600 domain-containing protein [Dechloromonas sp.]
MLQSFQKILLALTMALALPAMAQSDPPARVGRLAHIENQVDFRVDRNDQGGPATLNWPISSGAVLETGQRGRAEVWIGSTAYRLADDSEVEFPVVDDARVDVRVSGGSLAVSILDRDQVDDVVIATPDGNVRFLTPGRYRIDVFGDRSELSVQAGRAVFDDGQRATPVAAGQKVSHWSDGNEQLDADRSNDAFDRWVANRENVTLASQSRRHVSPHMTGYQDLDAYGDWQTAPDYGSVWYPRAVADDWAPYRYGRWAWVAPWGWTWIDQAPWGFAPFHYGRWAIIHGRWGWIPGRIVARPVYAPALVAWIGNPGWSVGFSFGAAPAVGWFPLAPREVYVPGHRHSPNYVRQINITHVRDVSIIDRAIRPGGHAPFAHHALPRAVTVVPANLVREGRPITSREIQRQERPALGRAPLARSAPNADWLAPAQGAVRPRNDERREPINRPRRDFDAPRLNAQERGAPRSEAMPRNPDRPAFRQPTPEAGNARDGDTRREGGRGLPDMRPGIENRGRPVEVAPATMPQRREAVPPEIRQPAPEAGQTQPLDGRRGGFRRPGDGQSAVEAGKMPGDVPPVRREIVSPEQRQAAPDVGKSPPAEVSPLQRRDGFRRPGEARPETEMRGRPPEAAPAPMRRDTPAPETRTEERQPRPMMAPQEREQRREVRDVQRMERPAPPPREREAPQIMRQPEMPRPAPEVRMPAPPPVREIPQPRAEPPRQEFRAPAPAPVPMPQQRAEPPRQPVQEFRAPPPAPAPMPQPRVEPPRQPAPPQGGQPEQRRRHGDEDDRRGR